MVYENKIIKSFCFRTTEVPAAKLPKHRPKPRYVTPPVKEPTTQTFNSSTDIRQAVFDEWKKERMEQAKKDLIEKKKKEKLEEEKKKKVGIFFSSKVQIAVSIKYRSISACL